MTIQHWSSSYEKVTSPSL